MSNPSFSVHVSHDSFKFSCAHFVASRNFRERLHGHNYTVEVKLIVNSEFQLNHDGYVIDFGEVKKAVRECCKELNEYLIVPEKSDVLDIKIVDSFDNDSEILCTKTNAVQEKQFTLSPNLSRRNVEIFTEDKRFFSIPECDCKLLPLVHSTAEELARYLWGDILEKLGGVEYLRDERGVEEMCVSVAERVTQKAEYVGSLRDYDINDGDNHTDLTLNHLNQNLCRVTDSLSESKNHESVKTPVKSMTMPQQIQQDGNRAPVLNEVERTISDTPNTTCDEITEEIGLSRDHDIVKSDFVKFDVVKKLKSQSESDPDSVYTLAAHFRGILAATKGEDVKRGGLKDTPTRAAKAWLESTSGYSIDVNEVVNGAVFELGNDDDANFQSESGASNTDSMIAVHDISVFSKCEHHLLPFSGLIHIGVVGNKNRVLGLSKYARVAEIFANRLQVQERLVKEICEAIWKVYSADKPSEITQSLGVIVLMTEGEHQCMRCRGAKKTEARTVTQYYKGVFCKKPELRAEFQGLCRGQKS